ncbi:hypothetical protein EW146_g6583 [Bondarzewia mesenterica]|uniref:DUF6533 domain-containing protein n=1 Tax=Bondarzewia mesenterica TaxID=1095465 RepID=A0A4S4LN48_9AGAM|nr:hypothetical protein EW146_g6583 [Bondarzewia mesenterica]
MDSQLKAELGRLLQTRKHMNMNTYLDVCAFTILVYDYTLTFEYEVKYMWNSKCSLIKVLFFATRYPAFMDMSLVLYHQFGHNLSADLCSQLYQATGWMFIGGVAIAMVIIMLRTWAIWGRMKTIGCGLVSLFIITLAPACTLLARFIKSLSFIPISTLGSLTDGRGCLVTRADETILGGYICLTVFDTVIVLLTIIKVIRLRKRRKASSSTTFKTDRHVVHSKTLSTLVVTMYRDGLLYYVVLLGTFFTSVPVAIVLIEGKVLSVVSVVILLAVSIEFVILLMALQRVTYSVLSARILLHIRKVASVNEWQSSLGSMTKLVIRRPEEMATETGALELSRVGVGVQLSDMEGRL